MMKALIIWKWIAENLEHKIPVILLYVLESKGSSPGRQGFFMAVNAKKDMQGSIGGGIMEHKFVEMAREKLRAATSELRDAQIRKQVHNKSVAKDQSGMICSGEQTILICEVRESDRMHITHIIRCLEENKNGTLLLSRNGIIFSGQSPEKDFHFEMKSEERWTYIEKLGYKNQLFIVGGGHCALSFSRLMSTMDFYIHLFDDREDLHTMEMNESVHRKKYVESYDELRDIIPSGDHHYVVIMTFGYRTDAIAVKALLEKNFKYLGLLGSKTKIQKMFSNLEREGIDKKLLKKIHAPIGVPINSQTPEEIAISIAAEIIKLKNEG